MIDQIKKVGIVALVAATCGHVSAGGDRSVYAPTTILATEKIPGVLNNLDNWKNITTHFRYIVDGSFPDGAEVEIGIDPSPEKFISELFYKISEAPLYKRGSCSIVPHKKYLTEFNRISLMIYPDMPDRAAIWLEAIGAPSWTAAVFPLKPRQWNEIWLDLAHLKPEERQRIDRLMVGSTALGNLPGDPKWRRYYLKDLHFEKVIPRNISGWEVSDGYVSLPQTGFTPWDTGKNAIFSGTLNGNDFRVCNSTDGQIKYQGQLTTIENTLGRFKIADFSKFKESGTYYIEAGGVRSPTFPITERPFERVIAKYLYWLYCMRSGMETPAHPECFLDDALREDTKMPVDMAGGWFDASDLRIYNSMSMTNVLRPLAIASRYIPGNSPIKRTLDNEAIWGAKFFNKLWDAETGLPFTMLCVHMPRTEQFEPLRKHYHKNNNFWTDNQRGTADDRIVHTPWNSTYIDGDLDNYAQHLGICAAAANFLSITDNHADEKLKGQMLAHTERHYARLRDEKRVGENRKVMAGVNLHSTTALAMSLEIESLLAGVTGKQQYLQDAVKTADMLLTRQQTDLIESENTGIITGFFDRNYSFLPSPQGPVNPVNSLLLFLESDPPISMENYYKYHAALRIHAEMFVRKIYRQSEPYCLPAQISNTHGTGSRSMSTSRLLGRKSKTNEKVYIANTFLPATLGRESFAIGRLAGFLDDHGLFSIASRLVSHQLGLNPSSWSFIADVGCDCKKDMMSTMFGYIPGMTSIGIEMKNGIPYYPQHYAHNEIYTQLTPILQAFALLDAPCRISGKLVLNGRPVADREILLTNKEFGKEYCVTTDRNGEFANVSLPGGVSYDIFCAGRQIDQISTIPGMKKKVEFNLDGDIKITGVIAPEKIPAGENFEVEVTLTCFSEKRKSIEIMAHGHNVVSNEKSRNLLLFPGINKVKFSFNAPCGNMPYVVMFNTVSQQKDIVSAAGAIITP